VIHDLGLAAARIVVGEGMAAHGAQKAFGWYGGPGLEQAAKIFAGMGFSNPREHATAAAWNEQIAGHLIAVGLGGPLGPALLISNMTVAAGVNFERGFFATANGAELPLAYISGALALACGGFGSLSLDHALGIESSLRRPMFTALALAGGIAAALVILNGRVRPKGEDSND
jgi:putative oxidoreductase